MQEDINNNKAQKPLGFSQPKAEAQYVELYENTSTTIKSHSADVMSDKTSNRAPVSLICSFTS